MIRNLLCLLAALLSFEMSAQQVPVQKEAFAHTYSIVAKDPATGEMAVGVQSHWFSVGTVVSWGKSGVGVVATQSFVNPSYGVRGLELMEEGISASKALEQLAAKDEGREYRQVAFLDNSGEASAFTGANCVESADHFVGENFSVQANMMLNDHVVPAMAEAFKKHSDLPLAERVMKVLHAAEKAGGDIRGKQSAALIVVGPEKVENLWEDKKIDLRVDDHEAPLKELDRLLKVARAYEFMNRGDVAMEEGDVEAALDAYGSAEQMFPENLEMRFWKAVALANAGRMEEALPVFEGIFKVNDNWHTMVQRLPAAGLLNVPKEEMARIVNLN